MTWHHNSYNVTSRRDNGLSQLPCASSRLWKRTATNDPRHKILCDQQRLGSACAYMQSDQSLCYSLEFSMHVMLLTEHHLEFLSLKRGCTGSSESTLVKMTHCWKSHVAAQIKILMVSNRNFRSRVQASRIILFPYTQSNDNLLKHFCHFS